MGIRLWGTPSKPRKPKVVSADAKAKAWANTRLVKMAKENPAIGDYVMAKLTGVDMNDIRSANDPLLLRQAEVKKKVTDLALKRIDQDPELQEQITAEEIERILGGGESRRHRRHTESNDSYEQLGGGDLDDTLLQIEKLEEVKAKLGGGNSGSGWAEILKDPQVVVGIMTLIQNALGKGNGHAVSPPLQHIYLLPTPEGVKELTPEQYRNYLITQQQAKLAAPVPPALPKAPPAAQASPETPAIVEESSEIDPAESGTLRISEWRPYLEAEPAVFYNFLQEKAELGDQNANFTLLVLRTKTAAEIIHILKQLTVNSEDDIKSTVEELSKRQDWLEKVIEIAKNTQGV